MNPVPADHDYVMSLVEAGMPREQAEVLARHEAQVISTQLATKRDLKDLKKDLLLAIGTMLGIAVALNTVIEKLFP